MPVRCNGFGGLLVCTHFRWMSAIDGLCSLLVLLSIGWHCCVLHAVLLQDDDCSYGVRSDTAHLGLRRPKGCPRSTVPRPQLRIDLLLQLGDVRRWVSFQHDAHRQRFDVAQQRCLECWTASLNLGNHIRLRASGCAWERHHDPSNFVGDGSRHTHHNVTGVATGHGWLWVTIGEELFSCVSTDRRGLVWRSVFEYVICLPHSNNGMCNDTKRIGVRLRKVFVQSSPLVIIVVFLQSASSLDWL